MCLIFPSSAGRVKWKSGRFGTGSGDGGGAAMSASDPNHRGATHAPVR